MHRLLIIGSLDENVELVKESKRRGYYTIVCDGYKDGIAKQYADKSYTINVRDTESIVQLCLEERIDGIVGSFSDLVFEKITEIASAANLKWYASPDMLKFYRDKTEAKKVMRYLGIRIPKFLNISPDFNEQDISDLKYPLVIKPNSGWGSKGVMIIDNLDQLHEYFQNENGTAKSYILEEYMPGKEHNAICWVVNGEVKIISIGDRNKNPRIGQNIPVLNRVVYPSNVLDELYPLVKNTLQKYVDYTGQTYGPLCMQFFYDNNDIQVCEIAGRILGHEHQMISRYSGINLISLLLDMTYEPEEVDHKFKDYIPPHDNHCAGLYLLCRDGYEVGDYTNAVEIAKEKCVFHSYIYYSLGDIIDNSGFRSYFAKYFITENTRDQLDNTTASIFDRWHIFSTSGEDISISFVLER